MAQSGVYAIQNLVTGRTYIGSSRRLAKRWSVHRADLKSGEHHSHDLQTDWVLYGESSFTFVVLERINDPQLLLISEQLHLDRLDNPYNINRIVDRHEIGRRLGFAGRGKSKSAAHRAKLSAIAKRRRLTPEHRAKIAASLLGQKRSDETRRKQSEAAKRVPHTWGAAISAAKKGIPNPKCSAAKKGCSQSAAMRAKVSAALKGRPLTAEHRAKIGAAQLGMKRSSETCQKLREAALRQWQIRKGATVSTTT